MLGWLFGGRKRREDALLTEMYRAAQMGAVAQQISASFATIGIQLKENLQEGNGAGFAAEAAAGLATKIQSEAGLPSKVLGLPLFMSSLFSSPWSLPTTTPGSWAHPSSLQPNWRS
ncbi:hypothetical protein [Ancylobacter defluvii]|uniref:hypothetical protein n=1 Tax=Ancylobacter defluvii TaxID=1282440 RepID=UPI001BCDA285|nr:hypothetical protein [Ancylobacter defluvii]MBS7587057.1 hypothetical protein [Ancylobacter defluvii]